MSNSRDQFPAIGGLTLHLETRLLGKRCEHLDPSIPRRRGDDRQPEVCVLYVPGARTALSPAFFPNSRFLPPWGAGLCYSIQFIPSRRFTLCLVLGNGAVQYYHDTM